ncbi:potassium channel family protein [Magnetofaba australis]|uniref:Putative TrkA domain-containing protein n=1 Tax=Magnetofaba australis IT-1 TaxID=1434232 RepID=A0A1Y2K3S7_9PROT|nr:potassium channel protein [Magnetofaba australis]OSM02582.1 putative TrkA domain-containing protein [Magnetofaba australis IT-1]
MVNTIGIIGFMAIDGYPFLDAVYQTVFTLTTVGYQETHPISNVGKLFVVLLILGGVLVWTYALGLTINIIVKEDLIGKLRESLMEYQVKQFRQHFIIVGYTEIARETIMMLDKQSIPYVVVDDDPERIAQANEDQIDQILPLNPFLNESYRRANVQEARGLITAFNEDSDNITAVVTGRIMEEETGNELLIITIATHHEARGKMLKVGADVVILPNELIGQRISAMALHPPDPEHSSFLDKVAFGEFLNLDIREVRIGRGARLDGVTIRESGVRDAIGAHILGIRKRGRKRLLMMPNPDIHITRGDQVLIMGTLAQLEKLPAFLHPEGKPPDPHHHFDASPPQLEGPDGDDEIPEDVVPVAQESVDTATEKSS